MRRFCVRRVGALVPTCGGAASWAASSTTVNSTNNTSVLRARLYATPTTASSDNSIKASDEQMQREIFRKAMEADDPPASMASMGAAEGFTEQHHTTPGSSDVDAFGHTDPLMAVEQTVRATAKSSSQASDAAFTTEKAELAKEIDQVVSSQNRRRNRRKRSMDAILGDVLHDALRLRDMGEKPTTDFVYKRTQERMYEEEYGKKPPTAKETAAHHIPFPPDFHLHRLLPLFGDATTTATADDDSADAKGRPAKPTAVYTKNHMNVYTLVPPDPWSERAITPENPVWTRRDVEADHQKTGGKGLKEWEERMFAPRPGYDLAGEFLDAMDELAYWERQFLIFVRVVPLSQRRSLPFLHEWYRLLVHRVVRAERRYIRVRDALLPRSKASAAVFAETEKLVENVRAYYAETHRSLSSANYDPLRMKKSLLAPILRMTDAEFDEWQEEQRRKRNALVAKLS